MSFKNFRKAVRSLFTSARTAPVRRTILGCETFEDRRVPAAVTASLGADGILHVNGTAGNDRINVREQHNQISVVGVRIASNGTMLTSVSAGQIKGIDVVGGAGNDIINLNSGAVAGFQAITVPANVQGGAGNDSIVGGAGNDTIAGGTGNDTISGAVGDDVISGATGNDILNGGAGDDDLSGGDGNDTLNGGVGSDLLNGGTGTDDMSDPDQGGFLTKTEGTVTAVDPVAMTVTVSTESGQSLTFQLTATTPIEVNDASATLTDVQIGMQAEVVLDASGNPVNLEAQLGD